MKEVIDAAVRKLKREANDRATGFVIGNTSDLFLQGRFYETPLRSTPELIYSGMIVRDVETAEKVARLIDGRVEYVFVDDEKKIRNIYYGPEDVGNIEQEVRKIVKRSTLLTYKGNDLAVESVDALVCNVLPAVSGSTVAVIGMGNFGSKVALKLVERGVHVAVHRRDQKKLRMISAGLNHIKSADTISEITPARTIAHACRGVRVVIGITNEKGVITRDTLKLADPAVVLVDAGKGCFHEDVASDPSFLIYRVDVSIMQKHIFLGLMHTHAHMQKSLGRRNIPELGATLITMGLLARPGEVIVDDIERPSLVIGIAARGGVLEKNTPRVQKRINEVKKILKIK